jgi:HEAT repeat protein
MAKLTSGLRPLALALGIALAGTACHADPDDPAGQAGELTDPVRREFALGNLQRLYGKVLSEQKSDRGSPAVKQFADVTVEKMVRAYLDNPLDMRGGEIILNLFFEMRDPRSLPALLKALEWRTEVNEEHAIVAARTLAVIDVPAADKPAAVKKLAEALDRVAGKRPVDNRMRIEFLRSMGELNDPAGAEVLTKVALRQSEEQNFLINVLAVEQLGKLADPSTVPALVEALYLFDPSNPGNRLNQAVPSALVRIGKPALQPLLAVLKGEDPKALAGTKAWIAAVRQRAPQAADQMTASAEMKKEAEFALGMLGFPEAIDPLIATASDADKGVALGAAVALASINRADSDTQRIRETMLKAYDKQAKMQRMQLLRAIQHIFDAGTLPFFLSVAKAPEEELPDIRVIALNAHALLANKAEAAAANALIAADNSPFKPTFEAQNRAMLTAAAACDQDLACWIKRLDDKDENVARKATYMLARLGRGKEEAVNALVAKIDDPRELVRGDVLSALDFVAVKGSTAGVQKIDQVRRAEDGRAIWNHVKERALSTQARLVGRAK